MVNLHWPRRVILSVAAALLLTRTSSAQVDMTLAEASKRAGSDQSAAHHGETIRVRGIVASAPVQIPEFFHLVVQDPTGAGLTILLPSAQPAPYLAGQSVEATGRLEERAGLPVLRPTEIRVTGMGQAPAPQTLTVGDLNQVQNAGRLVTVRGTVRTTGQNSGGEVLVLGEGQQSVQVFLPWPGRKRLTALHAYRTGDEVEVTGLSAQYCPIPPFDRSFEVIVPSAQSVSLVSRGWLISPAMFSWALTALALVMALWWWRERKMRKQREVLRDIMALAEDLTSVPTMSDIARRIEGMPEATLGAPDLEIYLYAEATGTLDRVITERARSPLSIPVDSPIGSLQALAAVCFRNRAMLAVVDLRRSPLVHHDSGPLPKSAVLAPMIAQGELTGVLVLTYRRRADLGPDFQLAVQHLANQVAASLRLQDQQLMKEQLLRSEKMAAAGQLISGVADDLRTPLANIERVAGRLVESATPVQRAGLYDIASEAQRGLDLVKHLLSFSAMEKREPKPLDMHGLLARLLEARREELERREIRVVSAVPAVPVEVWADQAQIEQAMLTVLAHAEEAASAAPDLSMRIESRIMGSRVQLVFSSQAPEDGPVGAPDLADYFGFPVAQAILQSHGGDLRCVQGERGQSRLELELPVLAPAAAVGDAARRSDKPARVMTALVVEPDLAAQRKLVAMLSGRGHRAIPAASAEEAADVVQRIQCDVMFCANRLPGLNWLELYQRARRRVGVFALLTEGYEADAAQAFGSGEGQVLSKPVEDRELDRVLGLAEVRWAVARQA